MGDVEPGAANRNSGNSDQSSSGPRVWKFVRAALIAYLLLVLAVTFLETWLVYPIPPVAAGDWEPAGLNYEDIWFASSDGTKLHGWFVPRANAKRALLYFHGNGEDVAHNADRVAYLSDLLDASVFIFDYRGYGHSEGTPDEPGCIADGLAAERWLAERTGRRTDQIVLMARSLGTAVAVAVAAEQGAQALVLENAFSRMTDVAARHYPWLPVRMLMRNRYDSLARIARVRCPLLQSHGSDDTLVPIASGRELFEASPVQEKRFLEFSGLGHNDPPPPEYYRELSAFVEALPPATTVAANQ
jgi:uncharacterized protein